MGVFSTVTFRCKECGSSAVDFQTKAGPECEHYMAGEEELPFVVLEDIAGEEAACIHCGAPHRIRTKLMAWVELLP